VIHPPRYVTLAQTVLCPRFALLLLGFGFAFSLLPLLLKPAAGETLLSAA